MASQKFIAYYIKEGKICAAAGMGKGVEILTLYEAFNQNKIPSVKDIKSGRETLETLRSKLKVGSVGCRRENCCQKKKL